MKNILKSSTDPCWFSFMPINTSFVLQKPLPLPYNILLNIGLDRYFEIEIIIERVNNLLIRRWRSFGKLLCVCVQWCLLKAEIIYLLPLLTENWPKLVCDWNRRFNVKFDKPQRLIFLCCLPTQVQSRKFCFVTGHVCCCTHGLWLLSPFV